MSAARVQKFDINKNSNAKEIQDFFDSNNLTAGMILKIVTVPRTDDELTILIFWVTEAPPAPPIQVAFEETESAASRVLIDARVGTEDDGANNGKLIFRTGLVVR